MPRFTLTKHADSDYDAEVTMEFTAEVVDLAQAHFHDFLQASGFEMPFPETESSDLKIPSVEDFMWDEAFEFKFKNDSNNVVDFPSTKYD